MDEDKGEYKSKKLYIVFGLLAYISLLVGLLLSADTKTRRRTRQAASSSAVRTEPLVRTHGVSGRSGIATANPTRKGGIYEASKKSKQIINRIKDDND